MAFWDLAARYAYGTGPVWHTDQLELAPYQRVKE